MFTVSVAVLTYECGLALLRCTAKPCYVSYSLTQREFIFICISIMYKNEAILSLVNGLTSLSFTICVQFWFHC